MGRERQIYGVVALGNIGASAAIDGSKGNYFSGTLTADTVLTVTNIPPGHEVTVALTQDATGGHAVTWVNVSNGTSPNVAPGSLSFIEIKGSTTDQSTNAINTPGASSGSVLAAWFGNGSDGNVTISAGTTVLSRDMFYQNLTINGTGVLNTNGWRVFVRGTLDITAAQAGAIIGIDTTNNGVNAAGATGGTSSVAFSLGTLISLQGGAGANGGVGVGAQGTAAINPYADALFSNGGAAGAGGAGGSGTAGAGGASRAALAQPSVLGWGRLDPDLSVNAFGIIAGVAGSGGSAGAGDAGANSGGGGGGGAGGGWPLTIYANTIAKSGATPAATITSNGGTGGHGGNSAAGNTGGGGGGGAGGGGWIVIAFTALTGPVITGLITATGGTGGAAGNGSGTGAGGRGGNGGAGGTITIENVSTGSITNTVGAAGSAGAANTGVTGGAGGAGGACTAAL